MDSVSTYTCKLNESQSEKLKQILNTGNYLIYDVPYSVIAARKENLNIVLYKSGKLVVQGKETKDFVEFILEPKLLFPESPALYNNTKQSPIIPHIGVDESGKGDFFGPLCIAGVYIDQKICHAWEGKGIQDSKNIKSDKKIAQIAQIIRTTPDIVQNVVVIGNEAYNRLHSKIKNINQLLAWGHARVIENLMGNSYQMIPPPQKAISDQFAATKKTVEQALMQQGRSLQLEQMHKAESDIAVAAASILARDEFVKRLNRLSEQYKIHFPKGATNVISTGREFVKKYGENALSLVAKIHFRTTQQCLSLTSIDSNNLL